MRRWSTARSGIPKACIGGRAAASTERKLQGALDAVMEGRTTFVIAHRLATIRNADRILVFHQGRIVESGTFDELVTREGRFAELARAQFMAPAHEALAA
jgi:ABC-type multidrug transport system fused ATPase/permease subunit